MIYLVSDEIYLEGRRLINFGNFDTLQVEKLTAGLIHKDSGLKPNLISSDKDLYCVTAVRNFNDFTLTAWLTATEDEAKAYNILSALLEHLQKFCRNENSAYYVVVDDNLLSGYDLIRSETDE